VIEALADRSLIRLGAGRAGEIRVDLLETIHSFARDRLEQSGEDHDVQLGHASYFADLVDEAEPDLRGARQLEWTDRLEDERPNLDAALAWSFGGGYPVFGLRIVSGLRDFWFYQGHAHDMRRWTARALDHVDKAEDSLRAGVLLSAGFAAYTNRNPRAVELLDDATALYEATNDTAHQALAQVFAAGSRELLTGDVDRIRAGVERGLELARVAGATPVEAQALNFIGEIERANGNLERAWDVQTQALEISRQTGEMRRIVMVTHNLGLIAHGLGDDETAERLLRESLELAIAQGTSTMTAHCLIGLAEQIARRGDSVVAAQLIGSADNYLAMTGVRPQTTDESDHTRIRHFVSVGLGPASYREAVAQGAQLELNEAVELLPSLPA
jgi:non-specific serine/threonine protein kinase